MTLFVQALLNLFYPPVCCRGLGAKWCNEGSGWLERLQLQRRSVLNDSSHPITTEFHLLTSSPGTQKARVKQQQM